jgi:hypothetical protein
MNWPDGQVAGVVFDVLAWVEAMRYAIEQAEAKLEPADEDAA